MYFLVNKSHLNIPKCEGALSSQFNTVSRVKHIDCWHICHLGVRTEGPGGTGRPSIGLAENLTTGISYLYFCRNIAIHDKILIH